MRNTIQMEYSARGAHLRGGIMNERKQKRYHALQRLKSMEDAYDTFIICHGAPVALKRTVDDLIALCEEVMAEEKKGNHVGTIAGGLNPYGDGRRVRETDRFMNRLDGGAGNLVYRPANIWNH